MQTSLLDEPFIWARGVWILMSLAALLLGFLLKILNKELVENTKKDQLEIQRSYAEDRRPIVLFIRDFRTDGEQAAYLSMPFNQSPVKITVLNDEVPLKKGMSKAGPFKAIGNPREKQAPIGGAFRSYFNDNIWQNEMINLMKHSGIIVIRPSTSEGLLWEINQVIENNYLHKSLIYLKGINRKKYKEFKGAIGNKLALPNYDYFSECIFFDENNQAKTTGDIYSVPLYITLSKKLSKPPDFESDQIGTSRSHRIWGIILLIVIVALVLFVNLQTRTPASEENGTNLFSIPEN